MLQDDSPICIPGVGETEVTSQFGRRGLEGRVEGAEAQREGLWDGLAMSAAASSEWECACACVHACPHVCLCARVCMCAGGGMIGSEPVSLYPPPLCPWDNGGSTLVDGGMALPGPQGE